MKEHNLHTEDTFLAKWLADEITDEALKKHVSETDFAAYQKLKRGIAIHEKLEAPMDASLMNIKKHLSPERNNKTKSKYNWLLAVAASVVVLFGLFNLLSDSVVTINTDIGQQKTLALLDGSEVILNSKSELSYDSDNWKSNRMLTLKGEAFFKVKKGSTFTVNTDNGSVTVLGTEFNVNSKGDYFQVVCYEGSVKVKNSDLEYVLSPKQHIRKINGNAVENWESDTREPTWIYGESSFKKVPIKYVINALSEQYDIEFLLNNIDETALYTGSFTHSNLNTALKTVFKTMQIQYIEKEKGKIELSQS